MAPPCVNSEDLKRYVFLKAHIQSYVRCLCSLNKFKYRALQCNTGVCNSGLVTPKNKSVTDP